MGSLLGIGMSGYAGRSPTEYRDYRQSPSAAQVSTEGAAPRRETRSGHERKVKSLSPRVDDELLLVVSCLRETLSHAVPINLRMSTILAVRPSWSLEL